MFTGIVEELGSVTAKEDLADAARFTVRGPLVTSDASHGDSIAVNGVCLTVVEVADGAFTADVMQETLNRSSLQSLAVGSPVNLERAASLASRLGGHLVRATSTGPGWCSRAPRRTTGPWYASRCPVTSRDTSCTRGPSRSTGCR